MAKKYDKFTVFDPISAGKEFFSGYDCDYWLHKIFMLKNCHDCYDKISDYLNNNLIDVEHEAYKRMVRTELHFLYFQMIETLFEIIFAISKHENIDLWFALTFSGDRKTEFYSDAYKKIRVFSQDNCKSYFFSEVPVIIEGKKMEIPRIRWIFYFIYPTKLTSDEWERNLGKIYSLLKMFSKDFSDRGEYNAFKHSLRFYNSSFHMGISMTGSNNITSLGSAKDSITYLEKRKKEKNSYNKIFRTTKPFDFERDFRCCLVIHKLIKNIINTRKYSFIEELHGKMFKNIFFMDINYPEDFFPKTNIRKSSFEV